MGAAFTSIVPGINLEVGGEGNIVINIGFLDKVRNFLDIQKL